MNRTLKNILIALFVLVGLYGLWYFSDLVIFILISVVISIIGAPLVQLMRKLKIGKFQLPTWFCALFTLSFLLGILVALITMFGPLVADEAEAFSKLDVEQTARSIEGSLVSFVELDVCIYCLALNLS